MTAHTEHDFIDPVVKIIETHKDGCMMEEIIKEIPNFISLNDEDKKPNPSRRGEERYKQVVRNLISHKNKELLSRINIETMERNRKRIFYPRDVSMPAVVENNSCENSSEYDVNLIDLLLDEYDRAFLRQIAAPDFNGKIQRSSVLVERMKKLCGYECQYSKLINQKQDVFYKDNGDPYVEVHHLIPLCAWEDFNPKSLDRPSNLVVLSDRWHTVLHHGSQNQIKEMLTVLYYDMIIGLNRDGIWISLEELLKYYE